jgi:Uncharacterized conserved protein
MCNLYTQTKSVDEVARLFRGIELPLSFPEGVPNLQPKEICITDSAPIVRPNARDSSQYELVVRRWSWPGANGKPVYNFRSEGREFGSGRCLIVADGFYEFTTAPDPGQKRKDRWLFTSPGEPLLGIAGLIRDVPGTGEAFTMLTTAPGPDVAPYHQRQIAVIPSVRWHDWLDYWAPVAEVIAPLAAGSLSVQLAPR